MVQRSLYLIAPILVMLGCGGEDPLNQEDALTQDPSGDRLVLPFLSPPTDVELSTCYIDKDGDGFGVEQSTIVINSDASCPKGYAGVGGDCADNDARAFPGQPSFFASPISLTGSWDFDCDGIVRLQHPNPPLSCELQGTDLDCHQWSDIGGPHWVEHVPACGGSGAIASGWGCTWDGVACNTNLAGTGVQGCR